jgi:hypothetical protein
MSTGGFPAQLSGHDAHSAEWAGLKGKKNGDLLRDAELAGYEILLTVARLVRAVGAKLQL